MDPLNNPAPGQQTNTLFKPLCTDGSLNRYQPWPHISKESSNSLVGIFIQNINTLQSRNQKQVLPGVMLMRATSTTKDNPFFAKLLDQSLQQNERLANGLGVVIRSELSKNLIKALNTRDKKHKIEPLNNVIMQYPGIERQSDGKYTISMAIQLVFSKLSKKKGLTGEESANRITTAFAKSLENIREIINQALSPTGPRLTEEQLTSLLV